MAKVKMQYFGLGMEAEGRDEFVARECAAFREYARKDAELDAEREERREREKTVELGPSVTITLGGGPVQSGGVERDVVAIYDDAEIPSIMHRFENRNPSQKISCYCIDNGV